jgi:excisionase family DNA binding protein
LLKIVKEGSQLMPELLTVKQVASIAGVTTDTVWSWIRANKIAAVRLPTGRYRVTREDLDNALGVARAKTPKDPNTKEN